MKLGELLELLYSAYDSFHTVQMDWQYRYDALSMNRVQERWAAQFPPGSVGILRSSVGGDSERSTEVKVNYKLWWRKPACWRDEQQMEGHGNNVSVTILCKGNWWAFSSGIDLLYTNVMPKEQGARRGIREVKQGSPPDLMDRLQGVPLLDPSFLLVSHELQPLADTLYLGREALQVRAVYRKAKIKIHEDYFWTTADSYDFLVDKEYGILLRYAALLDGQEFAVSSVDSVVFDEPIPDEVFAFPAIS